MSLSECRSGAPPDAWTVPYLAAVNSDRSSVLPVRRETEVWFSVRRAAARTLPPLSASREEALLAAEDMAGSAERSTTLPGPSAVTSTQPPGLVVTWPRSTVPPASARTRRTSQPAPPARLVREGNTTLLPAPLACRYVG